MKKIILTPNAPKAIGPYSQAILVKDTLYCSGQIAINPKDGTLNTSNIIIETTQVMENLRSVLKAADMTFKDVVKCSVFLKNLKNFDVFNKIYATYFRKEPPARETIQATLPKNVNVEISLIAVR